MVITIETIALSSTKGTNKEFKITTDIYTVSPMSSCYPDGSELPPDFQLVSQ